MLSSELISKQTISRLLELIPLRRSNHDSIVTRPVIRGSGNLIESQSLNYGCKRQHSESQKNESDARQECSRFSLSHIGYAEVEGGDSDSGSDHAELNCSDSEREGGGVTAGREPGSVMAVLLNLDAIKLVGDSPDVGAPRHGVGHARQIRMRRQTCPYGWIPAAR